jgi:hypothetical protein
MADFYPLIARAVAGLTDKSSHIRHALYERARTTLLTHLRGVTPPLSEADIVWQRLSLEEAIRKVESESGRAASYSAELCNRMRPPQFPSSKKPASIASSLSAKLGLRSASFAKLTAIWRSISGNRRSASQGLVELPCSQPINQNQGADHKQHRESDENEATEGSAH